MLPGKRDRYGGMQLTLTAGSPVARMTEKKFEAELVVSPPRLAPAPVARRPPPPASLLANCDQNAIALIAAGAIVNAFMGAARTSALWPSHAQLPVMETLRPGSNRATRRNQWQSAGLAQLSSRGGGGGGGGDSGGGATRH